MNLTVEQEDLIQKTQIEWEKLNVETNERLYVLQRAHTLYNEIEVLKKRVEKIIEHVETVFNETIANSQTLHEAKSHLNTLKVGFRLQNRFYYNFVVIFQAN